MITNPPTRILIRSYWPLLIIILLVSPLFLMRLAQSPNSWYDEGLNINAAQTLANTGQFGLTTAAGIRLADPAIQTGPPMIALIAIVGELFANNLFAIRIVMVVFGILTLISLYALTYRLFGPFAALLMVLMLVAMPANDTTSNFILLSRQFLGEIPAILCISLGCHLLLRANPKASTFILIGVCWGLAIIIKSQVLLILSAAVALWVLLRLLTNKRDKFYWMLTAIVMFGLYGLNSFWQNRMAGPMLADNLIVLREGIGIHILPFRALRNLQDWGTIVRFLASMITLGAFWFCIRPTSKFSPFFQQQTQPLRTTQNFIALLIIIWMVWFAFISIGWSRYSFVGLVFTFIIFAAVVSAIWSTLKLPTNAYTYLGLIAVAVLVGYLVNFGEVNDTRGNDFFNMVADIKANIPVGARIFSMEWAVDNFVPQNFISPTTHVINVITENAFVRKDTNFNFDSLSKCPQYLLLGSLALDAIVLKPVLDISKPDPLFQHGIYKLYEVNADQLPASCKTDPGS